MIHISNFAYNILSPAPLYRWEMLFGARRNLLVLAIVILIVFSVFIKVQLSESILNQLENEHRNHLSKYFFHMTGNKSNQINLNQNTNTPLRGEYWLLGEKELIEKAQRPPRTLSDFESGGNNIMITIRTTRKFHQKRLPYLFDTWLNKVNGSNVFLVTDEEDEEYQEKSKELGLCG